jgi:hypothetical protein
MLRTALGFVSGVTIAAACVLAVSYVTLKGTGDRQPLVGLAVFAGLSALLLAASLVPLRSDALAAVPAIAGTAIAWVGWTTISHMLASPHFEGYALILGALGMLQGLLAISATGWRLWGPAAAPRS